MWPILNSRRPLWAAGAALWSCGCEFISPPGAPVQMMFVCDESDGAPCTDTIRAAQLDRLRMRCARRAGCTLREVLVRSSFATAVVRDAIVTPSVAAESEEASVALVDAFWSNARHDLLAVPACDKACRRGISSDILGAISAGAYHASGTGGSYELVVATDGLEIGECANFERKIPDNPDELLRCLETRDERPNLKLFTVIEFCGLRTSGLSPAQVAARDAALGAYVAWGGGPKPRLLATCPAERNTP